MESDFSRTLIGGKAGLGALLDDLEAGLAARGVPVAVTSAVMLAADEVISNVLDHGDAGQVEVSATVGGRQVAIDIIDDGAAFDPLAAAVPDTGLSLEDRSIGGLGIHLVRQMMDNVRYERRGNQNCLRFSKSYVSASAPSQPT